MYKRQIHSYAEGLKERIAEGKRDKYLGVILSEAERADTMVLEMLDLSRLEAGKVKIERTEFSLPELARSVFARFEMAAQAKGLEVEFDFPEEMCIRDSSQTFPSASSGRGWQSFSTAKRVLLPCRSALTMMHPPSGVYFTAFAAKFSTTCARRPSSAATLSSSGKSRTSPRTR